MQTGLSGFLIFVPFRACVSHRLLLHLFVLFGSMSTWMVLAKGSKKPEWSSFKDATIRATFDNSNELHEVGICAGLPRLPFAF